MYSTKLLAVQFQPRFPFPSKIGSSLPKHVKIACCSDAGPAPAPPVIKKRKRHRKQYPGEAVGITEEMRFAAMRLRNEEGKYAKVDSSDDTSEESNYEEKTWIPTIEGFLKYLVDSKLVFRTVERIIDLSDDVSYAYFRKTGLERLESLEKDLEWFRTNGNRIPEAGTHGIFYAEYLEELSRRSVPLFLCHFYNLYFTHIAGGQVIARQVSQRILDGKELAFCNWDGDAEELLKDVREKLNLLGKHWTRDEKNRCLRESSKCYKYLGQLIRLNIL